MPPGSIFSRTSCENIRVVQEIASCKLQESQDCTLWQDSLQVASIVGMVKHDCSSAQMQEALSEEWRQVILWQMQFRVIC